MKWKIFILVIAMILLVVAPVRAFEFDNIKTYDEKDRSILVKNSFLGIFPLGEVAKITPLTPHNLGVIPGEDRLVAEFEIDAKETYTEKAFDDMNFFDLNAKDTGYGYPEFDRDYTLKRLVRTDVTSEIKEICYTDADGKKTSCENKNISNSEKIWEEIDTKNDLVKGVVTIGVFADVYSGDYVEFIPTWFGVYMPEYSTWSDSLNIGLQHYYKLDEGTGDVSEDSVAGNNVSDAGSSFTWNSSGIINDMITVGSADKYAISDSNYLYEPNLTQVISVSFWSEITLGANQAMFDMGTASARFTLKCDVGDTDWYFEDGSGGVLFGTYSTGLNHHVVVFNLTDLIWYVNGAVSGTGSYVVSTDTGSIYLGTQKGNEAGRILLGSIDEVGIWNRTLSEAEVTQLYNGGTGISYARTQDTITTTSISPTDYTNTTNPSVEFNCSATPDLARTVTNISLYENSTGVWVRNLTNSSINTAMNSSLFTINFDDGTYKWNCFACDNASNCSYGTNKTFSIDTTIPEVTILAPSKLIDYHKVNTNISLNWTVTDPNLQACWYNYNGTNYTAACADGNVSVNLTRFINEFTFWANDSFANVNKTVYDWDYKIFENSRVYNATTYSSSTETYKINVTTNTSATAANLVYNGTEYAAVKNGEIWSSSITHSASAVSGIREIYWSYTYAGGTVNTSNSTQTINPIVLGLCNSTLNVLYVNFTFKDETTNTFIDANVDSSTWTYWLGTGGESSTFLFSNTSASNPSYAFCFSPEDKEIGVDLTFKYSNTSYPLRTFSYDDQALTNTTTNQVLYLLGSADGIYSSINVIDPYGNVIGNVLVTIERQINDVWTTIGQGVTGSDGLVTFWVNPNYPHRVTATKTGYTSTIVTITPSQSLYTLTLSTGTSNVSYTDPIAGLKWQLYPGSGVLKPGVTNFNVTVTSSQSNLENCKLEILDTDLAVVATSTFFTNSTYCYTAFDYTTVKNQDLFGRLSIDTTNTTGFVIVDSDWKWILIDIDAKAWRGIGSFFSDLNTIGDFGEGNEGEFSRVVLFFILTTIFVGVFAYFSGIELSSPGISIFIVWFVVLVASVGGFLTVDYGGTHVGAFTEKFSFFLILTFFSLGYFLNTMRRANE